MVKMRRTYAPERPETSIHTIAFMFESRRIQQLDSTPIALTSAQSSEAGKAGGAMAEQFNVEVNCPSLQNYVIACHRVLRQSSNQNKINSRQKRSLMPAIRISMGFLRQASIALVGILLLNSGPTVTAFTRKYPSFHSRSTLEQSLILCTTSSTLRRTISISPQMRFITAQSMSEQQPSEDSESENYEEQQKRKRKRIVEGISNTTSIESELLSRITKLDALVARHEVDLLRLRREVDVLGEAAIAFARLTQMLQKAGLADAFDKVENEGEKVAPQRTEKVIKPVKDTTKVKKESTATKTVEYFDDSEIFGTAPSSVIDAGDAAGASILACMLGGKQRMLVDVRDAELSRDPEILVQFVELAILPVAAGLEGLPKKIRNRVKIVFPTVSQLLQYRRTMSLVAPDVVALSTLGFDPVEKQDILVVILAPAPDDEEGLDAMNELLAPTNPNAKQLRQPVVVINHHMVPLSGPAKDFDVAYHLRLLSVQYMSGDNAGEPPEYLQDLADQRAQNASIDEPALSKEEEDAELEAAMKHAHEIGMNHGVTRAMVIRAYPKPWHVFVDTSPDTDADFEVAATFDEEPTQDDVNFAIVECLEGSETEDELVAYQMQQALEAGQLDRVTDMLGIVNELDIGEMQEQTIEGPLLDRVAENMSNSSKLEDDENFYEDFDDFKEDSC